MIPNKSNETAVLDPTTFITGRLALGLDELGIHIREADWGDADQEVFYVRQELGEIPGDRHPPNRTVVLKLKVAEDVKANINLAEAALRLQQKIGVLQREGGWVMRSFSSRARARVSVGLEVYNAVLTGVQGWLLGHHAIAHEVTLTLTCSPYCYGPEEIEGTSVVTETGRGVEWLIEKAPGTAQGKLRLRIKNEGGTDWLGIYGSSEQVETRTATNKMMYEAEELTLQGGSSIVARTGASGNVVKATASFGWQTILSSKTTAGHMTHVGGRRILTRVFNNSATIGGLAVRLEWRSNSGEWETNEETLLNLTSGWQIVDLGELISHQATLGTHKLEFRVQVKFVSGSSAIVEFDKFFILSQNQFIKLRKSVVFPVPSSYLISGAPNPVGTAGEALNGKNMTTGGGKWETSGSAKGDFLLTGKNGFVEETIKRTAVSDTERRKALVSAPTMTNGIVQLTFGTYAFFESNEGEGLQKEIGLLMHGGNVEAILKVYYEKSVIRYEIILKGTDVEAEKVVASASFDPSFFFWATLSLGCIGSKVFVWTHDPTKNAPLLVSNLTSTAAGKVGMFAMNPKAKAFNLSIYSFAGYESESDTLVHVNKLFDVGSAGSFRQHAEEDNWGIVPPEEGFYPFLLPGGLEQRVMQGMILPSNGDFLTYDDGGSLKPKVTPFYRPAYHFMSEAG